MVRETPLAGVGGQLGLVAGCCLIVRMRLDCADVVFHLFRNVCYIVFYMYMHRGMALQNLIHLIHPKCMPAGLLACWLARLLACLDRRSSKKLSLQ